MSTSPVQCEKHTITLPISVTNCYATTELFLGYEIRKGWKLNAFQCKQFD